MRVNIILILSMIGCAFSDFMFDYNAPKQLSTDMKDLLNLTTGGPYTYSQSGHNFYGTCYNCTYIDTYGCCSDQSGSFIINKLI
jgi:hypothetical protein